MGGDPVFGGVRECSAGCRVRGGGESARAKPKAKGGCIVHETWERREERVVEDGELVVSGSTVIVMRGKCKPDQKRRRGSDDA